MSEFVKAEATGLKELRNALKTLDLQKSLTQANKRVVDEIVVPEARRLMSRPTTNLAGNVTRLGTRGVKTIKGSATQTKARIQAGSKRVPYYHGQDFGSTGRYRQFPRAVKGGRGLYKALETTHERMIAAWMEAIDEVTHDAFPD